MRVGGSQIQTLVNNTLQNRDLQRQQKQQRAREQEKTQAQQQQPGTATYEQDVQFSDAGRRANRNQQVPAAEKGESTQRNYQYYPFPDRSGLSASQQKALQAYSNTQDLSRTTDGHSEFLGSVDVFV